MAFPTWNVDPLVKGPFVGVPETTQIATDPDGFYQSATAGLYQHIVNADRVLPQYAMGNRVPTAGEASIESYSTSVAHTCTVPDQGTANPFMPIFMAVGKLVGSGTIYGSLMVGQAQNNPAEIMKWGLAYRDTSHNVDSNGIYRTPQDYGGVRPECCYVWRPGSGLVGFIFSCRTMSYLIPQPELQNPLGQWKNIWGCSGRWISTSGYGDRSVEPNHLRNVTYQDGDLLIVEYHASCNLWKKPSGGTIGAVTLSGSVQIGGGTNRVSTGSTWDVSSDDATPFQNTEVPYSTSGTPPTITTPDYPSVPGPGGIAPRLAARRPGGISNRNRVGQS